MHPAGRCFVGELQDGMRDPSPDSLTRAITGSCKRISASWRAIGSPSARFRFPISRSEIWPKALYKGLNHSSRNRRFARFKMIRGMSPILTAEDVVKRIVAERAFVDERGAA